MISQQFQLFQFQFEWHVRRLLLFTVITPIRSNQGHHLDILVVINEIAFADVPPGT